MSIAAVLLVLGSIGSPFANLTILSLYPARVSVALGRLYGYLRLTNWYIAVPTAVKCYLLLKMVNQHVLRIDEITA